MYLTPPGIHFAEADVLEEKVVFREQAAANVQLIQKILETLKSSSSGRVRQESILSELEHYFSRDEAERQLDTAIDWGRYAELFAYDDKDGVFYRDQGEVRT